MRGIRLHKTFWIIRGIPPALILLLLLASCNVTRYVPEHQYLLGKNTLNFDKSAFKRDELKNYIKQKPNQRILGVKFHLSLYSLSDINKNNWFNRWLRKIGEAPVIMDPYLVDKSTQQLNTYAHNKGYFNASVTKFIVYHKRRCKVSYTLQSGKPYTIRKIGYIFEDTTLSAMILRDSLNVAFKKGNIYDSGKLQAERERIERYLKNRGYYSFTKEYVYYEADSTAGKNQVDLFIGIKPFMTQISPTLTRTEPHKRYSIGKVYVYMDYDTRKALEDQEAYYSQLDTLVYDGIYFIGENLNFSVRPEIVKKSNYILSGETYNLTNVDKTYEHLGSLRIFRLVNIVFHEASTEASEQGTYPLDCVIQLSTFRKQSYSFEVEGTNSSGNLGVAGNLIYQHKNLFKGAEFFDVRLKGAVEALADSIKGIKNLKNTLELGSEVSLQLPRFLFPFLNTESFIKNYDPKTRISLAYNYQQRPDYTRTIAKATFGYQWNGNSYTTFLVNPFELNMVRIYDLDTAFAHTISGTFLEFSFRDVLISETSLGFVYNNQNIKKRTDFTFFRLNASSAGNILTAAFKLLNRPKPYILFGNEYAQYVKADVDLSYHQVLNEASEFVYRVFLGTGVPYGNTKVLPFDKRYFSGGANSLRAWTVRRVGPGSYYQEATSLYPNQTGDIRLEGNMEYRFDLLWVLEGALFVDAGNVWDFYADAERPNSNFAWNRFYKEFALGTGFGLRFDFSFFLIRLDIGLKLHDPTLPLDNKWTLWNNQLSRSYKLTAFQIGIGYPF